MANLKTQGLKPGLLRQLGFFSATALVISNMVGTGIFATTGFMAGDLGSASMILACWGVGALFAFAGALSYSELGINFPSSGGEYVYLTHAFGPEWGFMTGWVSFFAGFSAPIAAAALAFSDYLGYFFPSLRQANATLVIGSGAFSLRLGGGQLAACGLIAAFTNAGSVIQTRRLADTETTSSIVFYFSMYCALAGLATLPFGWIWPTPFQFAVLIASGVIGGLAHIVQTSSYQYAPASLVAPIDYTMMIWAYLLGYVLFGELPTSRPTPLAERPPSATVTRIAPLGATAPATL
jgi:amino acid transporter